MPRGGARPGSGPAPDPNSARSKARAARIAREAAAASGGYTARGGKKKAEAPESWPFGTVEPKSPPPAEKPKADEDEVVIPGGEPLEFLQAVINETRLTLPVRMQAAALAVSFKHAKPAPMGKKEGEKEAAKKTAGRFAAATPPKLVAAGGKKVHLDE